MSSSAFHPDCRVVFRTGLLSLRARTFAVASFYVDFHDFSDEEVVTILGQHRKADK